MSKQTESGNQKSLAISTVSHRERQTMKSNLNVMLKNGFLIAVATFLLSGCGGGGGGTAAAPAPVIDPNLTVPVQTAIANLVNKGMNRAFTVTGWIDNSTTNTPVPRADITGSGTLTIGTPTAATFNGSSVLRSTEVITGTVTVNGRQSSIASSGTTFYNSSNYTIAGTVVGGETTFIAPYTYPTTVKAGNTGSFGNSTSGGLDGGLFATTSTTVYTVASDTATSLLVTLLKIESGPGATVTTQTVYRISTSGDINLVSIDSLKHLTRDYQKLTFTF